MVNDTSSDMAGGHLRVDLGALAANYRRMANKISPSSAAAVVKADAYGLGAGPVCDALAKAGCRDFFVAHLEEALAVRATLADDARLYVLNGLMPGTEAACATAGVVPVLNSLEQASRWRDLARDLDRPLAAALQLDTGMARLGLSPDAAAAIAGDAMFFHHVPVDLVMSHLACSDEPERASNADQARVFAAMADLLPRARRSLASSGGAFLPRDYHGDLVRLGLCLYGAAPREGVGPLAPVVSLDARVIQVRSVRAGEGVGYGLTFHRDAPGAIATIGVGYGDGWPRALSNKGAAYYRGHRLPIAGRVSMDSITLDVTGLVERGIHLGAGDTVELLGPHQSLEAVAHEAGTIAYEILTNLGRRYRRTYLETPMPDVDDSLLARSGQP